MQIKVINAKSWNWYHVGEIYTVLDAKKYDIGIQVVRENNGHVPDVIEHGDYIVLI